MCTAEHVFVGLLRSPGIDFLTVRLKVHKNENFLAPIWNLYFFVDSKEKNEGFVKKKFGLGHYFGR
jgi:hypothetical protein